VAEVEVLGQLLGEGGAALHGAALAQVCDRRPHHAQGVDAVVFVEALVLGGDHRIGDVAGQEIERHVVIAAAALADHRAIACQDPHVRCALLRPQSQGVRIDQGVIDHQRGDAGDAGRQRIERGNDQHALQRGALGLRR
jgi:hypothetical protein